MPEKEITLNWGPKPQINQVVLDDWRRHTVPTRIVCEVCREDTYATVRGDLVEMWPDVAYAEHLGPDRGMCRGSNMTIANRSRLPGWHAMHECGMFCDGQDGASSECATAKRRGPPSIVETIGLLDQEK